MATDNQIGDGEPVQGICTILYAIHFVSNKRNKLFFLKILFFQKKELKQEFN